MNITWVEIHSMRSVNRFDFFFLWFYLCLSQKRLICISIRYSGNIWKENGQLKFSDLMENQETNRDVVFSFLFKKKKKKKKKKAITEWFISEILFLPSFIGMSMLLSIHYLIWNEYITFHGQVIIYNLFQYTNLYQHPIKLAMYIM